MFIDERVCGEFLGGLCVSQLFYKVLKCTHVHSQTSLKEYQDKGKWGNALVDEEDLHQPPMSTIAIPTLDKNHERILYDKLELLLLRKQMCYLENSSRLVRKVIPLFSDEISAREKEIGKLLNDNETLTSQSLANVRYLISEQKKAINVVNLETVPSLSNYLEVCPTCAIVVRKPKCSLPNDVGIQKELDQVFSEFEIAIPLIERESIRSDITMEEHDVSEEYHLNWIKIKETFTKLNEIYSPDKGIKRSLGSGSSKGSK